MNMWEITNKRKLRKNKNIWEKLKKWIRKKKKRLKPSSTIV